MGREWSGDSLKRWRMARWLHLLDGKVLKGGGGQKDVAPLAISLSLFLALFLSLFLVVLLSLSL